MDASALGFPKGEPPYPRLPAVLTLSDAHNVPDELIGDVHAVLGA